MKEENIAGWQLQEQHDGKVKNILSGKVGKILPSSGHSWKDIEYEEEKNAEEKNTDYFLDGNW
jgi:hypothetical protein